MCRARAPYRDARPWPQARAGVGRKGFALVLLLLSSSLSCFAPAFATRTPSLVCQARGRVRQEGRSPRSSAGAKGQLEEEEDAAESEMRRLRKKGWAGSCGCAWMCKWKRGVRECVCAGVWTMKILSDVVGGW